MRLKKVKGAEEKIRQSKYIIDKPEEYKGKYKELLNENPLEIEIGMGKGTFIINKALQNPNINYIGIEKFDSVIVRAVEKLEDIQLSNLKLIRMDATEIENIFDKEIDTIYLNFSDPWPKERHSRRRLSSKEFLKKYDNLFKKTKRIIMKTDNRKLFEFSIKSFTDYGYKIVNLSLDLYSDDIEDNIPTEYETKFVSLGQKIYMIEVEK